MKISRIALVATLVVLVLSSGDLLAQGRGKGHAKQKDKDKTHARDLDRNRDDDDRDDDGDRIIYRDRDGDRVIVRERRVRRDRDDDDDDDLVLRDRRGRVIVIGNDDIDRRFERRSGNGPPFCRSGAGHPVHGRRWCLEKGWGLGDRDDIFFGNGEIFFWEDGDPVIVRDRRFREPSVWERALDTVLFWTD